MEACSNLNYLDKGKNKMKSTIEEFESRLQQSLEKSDALQPLVAKGYRVKVTLRDDKRKKRKDASADTWSPESDLIQISFEKEPEDAADKVVAAADAPQASRIEISDRPATSHDPDPRLAMLDPLSDLIRCLDQAESRPGYTFVALKWFRDVALPAGASTWAQSDAVRSNILRDAIERRIVLTGRIPNPKSPQFPVTTIKLNRLIPEVRSVLGTGGSVEDGFEPITIRGESLSATVLRERR
jgi:hypothetical protein